MPDVWGTMAEDMVFTTQHVYDGFVPQYARSLAYPLKDYLAFDSPIWQSRPSPPI